MSDVIVADNKKNEPFLYPYDGKRYFTFRDTMTPHMYAGDIHKGLGVRIDKVVPYYTYMIPTRMAISENGVRRDDIIWILPAGSDGMFEGVYLGDNHPLFAELVREVWVYWTTKLRDLG